MRPETAARRGLALLNLRCCDAEAGLLARIHSPFFFLGCLQGKTAPTMEPKINHFLHQLNAGQDGADAGAERPCGHAAAAAQIRAARRGCPAAAQGGADGAAARRGVLIGAAPRSPSPYGQ